jgi:hypothetical protein
LSKHLLLVNFLETYWSKVKNCTGKPKGIDRSFELRGESRLNRFVMTNWRLGNIFLFHFKGLSSQDQQKTKRRRLIISKVTLTGQSHFVLIFLIP